MLTLLCLNPVNLKINIKGCKINLFRVTLQNNKQTPINYIVAINYSELLSRYRKLQTQLKLLNLST